MRRVQFGRLPLSRKYGTHKTVKARFWYWLAGKRRYFYLKMLPFCSEAGGAMFRDARTFREVLSQKMSEGMTFRVSASP